MSKWYDDARLLDQVCYDHKLADYPRGLNRARILDLANGKPPYTEEEAKANNITVNINSLELTNLAHSARMQFLQGFVKPGKYFACATDFGPKNDRQRICSVVTKEINRTLKDSVAYYEAIRGQFALLVLHGISPSVWENKHRMIPRVIGVEDALLPSGTLLGFENLPHAIFYRSFTGMELQNLVFGSGNPDPGWNVDLVKRVIKWVDEQATTLMHNNWPEIWAPEKAAERLKSNSGFYAADQLPTIDCFDIYVYVDNGKKSGWVRRIILDAWGEPSSTGVGFSMSRKDGGAVDSFTKTDWLYSSKNRCVANKLSEIATWQFADLSAGAPFRYHSVRSLGFLLYAVCHVQQRMRCSFMESVFEALSMLLKVKSPDDVQRALQITLGNRKFIDDSFEFVKASDRYQVNAQLVELGLMENDRLIKSHAGTMTPQIDFKDRTEKTKFQVMAELNVTQALVGAGLQQAYMYKKFEYIEILRRGFIRDSRDPRAREFQARCVRQGVPIKMLIPDIWEVEPERIMGQGNKTMELAIAEQLMQWRPMYDPPSQRMILRESTAALTDDPARADLLVPEEPKVSNSVHDAQLAAGALMQGLPVDYKEGTNEPEYIATLLTIMQQKVQLAEQMGGMMPPEEIKGMQNMIQHTGEHLQTMAADKSQQPLVRGFSKALSEIQNSVKGYQQRLMEQMKKNGQNGNGQADAELQSELRADQIKAQAKAENTRASGEQRMAQKQQQFEQQMEQDRIKTQAEIERDAVKTAAEITQETARTKAQIENQPKKSSKE